MEILLLVPMLVSFLISLFFIPLWIKKAKQIGLLWEDMHKKGGLKNVAGSGGIIVVMGFILGVLVYIAMKTFYFESDVSTVEIFSLIATVLIAGFIGFTDDILGWVRGGLPARFRIVLLFFSAIPLMVINAGEAKMLGIELGLLFPLIFIPIGIIGAASTFNLLAGYNGLEASQGIFILLGLATVTFIANQTWLTLICLCMIASLLGFLIFNKFPAKVFPGDIMTYSVGALIAVVAILGNIEKIAIFFFIPYILEAIFKLRGNLKKQSFAKVNEDRSLEIPYNKFYGLEHISVYLLKKIKKTKKVYETDVVYFINLFQVVIIILGFLLFRSYLIN